MNEEEKIEFLKILLENLGQGSYRWLIYDKLGLSERAYVPLCEAGLLELNNEWPIDGAN